jgi:predicted metal-dependent peptidase
MRTGLDRATASDSQVSASVLGAWPKGALMPAHPREIRRLLSAPTRRHEEMLATWRAIAVETMPYMASILFLLRPVNAPGLGTFATDNQMRLYIDFDAVADTGELGGAEALLHECSHVLQGHLHLPAEIPDARPELLNEAADLAINDDLVEAGCEWIARNGLTPTSEGMPDGLTPHEYYRILAREAEAVAQHWNAGEDGHPPERGDLQSHGYGCGPAAAAPGGYELDPHDDLDSAAPPVSEPQREAAIVSVVADARDHDARVGRLPGGIAALVEAVLAPPEVSWRQTIAAFVRRAGHRSGHEDTSHARRSRRRHDIRLRRDDGGRTRVVYPAEIEPDPRIAVIRDTSQSMDEELAAISREIEGIAAGAGVRGDRLRIHDVDTDIRTATAYRRASDIAEATGRGGTGVGTAIVGLCQRQGRASGRPRPDLLIALTDGHTDDWPQHSLGMPVIAGIVGESNWPAAQSVPDWIHVVPIPIGGNPSPPTDR